MPTPGVPRRACRFRSRTLARARLPRWIAPKNPRWRATGSRSRRQGSPGRGPLGWESPRSRRGRPMREAPPMRGWSLASSFGPRFCRLLNQRAGQRCVAQAHSAAPPLLPAGADLQLHSVHQPPREKRIFYFWASLVPPRCSRSAAAAAGRPTRRRRTLLLTGGPPRRLSPPLGAQGADLSNMPDPVPPPYSTTAKNTKAPGFYSV